MMNEQEFRVPAGLADKLKMTAICETHHTGLAAIALIRAAAEILCKDFGAEQTCDVIRDVTSAALSLHGTLDQQAGHA